MFCLGYSVFVGVFVPNFVYVHLSLSVCSFTRLFLHSFFFSVSLSQTLKNCSFRFSVSPFVVQLDKTSSTIIGLCSQRERERERRRGFWSVLFVSFLFSFFIFCLCAIDEVQVCFFLDLGSFSHSSSLSVSFTSVSHFRYSISISLSFVQSTVEKRTRLHIVSLERSKKRKREGGKERRKREGEKERDERGKKLHFFIFGWHRSLSLSLPHATNQPIDIGLMFSFFPLFSRFQKKKSFFFFTRRCCLFVSFLFFILFFFIFFLISNPFYMPSLARLGLLLPHHF